MVELDASNNLSSTLLPVLDTIFFTLFTKTLATILLTNKDIIIDMKIIIKSPRLIPKLTSLKTLMICKYKLFNKIHFLFFISF